MHLIQRASLVSAMLMASGTAAAQTTWFVDASATPPGNGTPGSPYTSIQYALDQPTTVAGDSLSIAAGVYPEHVDVPSDKVVDWLAPAGPQATILEGGLDLSTVFPGSIAIEGIGFTKQPVLLFQVDVEMRNCWVSQIDPQQVWSMITGFGSLTMEDCVITGNPGGVSTLSTDVTLRNTDFLFNGPSAGALEVSGGSLLAEDCRFTDNDVLDDAGGAIALATQSATLRECVFMDNSAYLTGRRGGAIDQWSGNSLVEDCQFVDNESDQGGAIALSGTAHMTVVASSFRYNAAERDGTGMLPGQGGAIHVAFGATLDAMNCEFRFNSAAASGFGQVPGDQLGGAVFAEGPGSALRDCNLFENSAYLGGSAVHGPFTIERCLVLLNISNVAGGTIEGGALLDRSTVVKNTPATGAAAVLGCTVSSSIIWGNAVAQLGGGSSVDHSCIQGGAPGPGNIDDDPTFVDFAGLQLDLAQGSPCIDAGAPTAPLDGDLTPADMGALPFTWQPMGTSYCSTNPNSSGLTAVMAALGSPAVADDFVRLQATQVPPHQLGLFIMSPNQGFVPLFNGSQGNLCVSAPIYRLVNTPGSVSSSGAPGVLNLRLGLTTLPAGLQVLPGQTWHLQGWFRDEVAGQQTSNTTDAVSVTFR